MIPQGGNYDITVYQGAAFSVQFQLFQVDGVTPFPLTGYTAEAQIRANPGAPDKLAEFDTVIDDLLGKVTLSLTGAETALLVKNGAYDVFLTNVVDSYLFIQGTVIVDRRVTVPD